MIQPTLNRVSGEGASVQVEPRLMQVLAYLAAHPGKVITRDVLLDEVWHDLVVNEAALTRTISELRKILNDDARKPRYIETIRKGGYRLIAPILDEPQPADAGLSPLPSDDGQYVELAVSPPVASPKPSRLRPFGWVVLGMGLAALGFVAYQARFSTPAPAPLFEARPFTSFAGREIHPALSPDGNKVAFAWNGNRDLDYDLYVKQTSTETPLQLTEGDGTNHHPTWSPDGNAIAFVRTTSAGSGIYTIPTIGGPVRKVTATASWVPGLAWSPDGQRLVFAERTDPSGPYQLYSLVLDTADKQQLTEAPAQFRGDTGPAFSPDGQWIAFTRSDRLGGQDIYLLPANGGTPKRLTAHERGVSGLAWTPDGEALVFASYRNGTYSLWRLAIDDGTTAWVPSTGQRIYNPTIAGNRLVFEQFSYEKNIWQIQRDTGVDGGYTTTRLINSTQWDWESNFAPDGHRLAFLSSRSGALEIWIADRDGANPVQVTQFNGASLGNPRWSPDGTRIAFHASPEGHAALYLVDGEGGPVRRLSEGSSNALAASWSRDGRWLYFGSDRNGTWDVWKHDPDTGETVQVTTAGGLMAYESADGARLYFNKPDRPGLWQMPSDGGSETLVLESLSLANWGNWAVVQNSLYFADQTDKGAVVVMFDLATRQITTIAPVRNLASPSLAVSPDGQTILYASLERRESDLMLIEPFE